MSVAIVTNIPRPYRHALFNELARLLDKEQLHVVYTSDPAADPRRRDVRVDAGSARYVPHRARSLHVRAGGRVRALAYGVGGILGEIGPTAAIIGGFGPDALAASRSCRRMGVPYVAWSGAWQDGGPAVTGLRLRVRRSIARSASGGLSYGSLASEYLLSLGIPRERIVTGVNTVDLEWFATRAAEARRQRGTEDGLGRADAIRFLCVGTLEANKHVDTLLEAAASIPRVVAWTVHVVGAGNEDARLKSMAAALGIGELVTFHGFKQAEEVARLYGLCDALVFPATGERWGLVVNEAQACGLPVVASRGAGVTADLVDDGVSGIAVDGGNTDALRRGMADLLDARRRAALGAAAAVSVRERASLRISAQRFADAFALGRERGPRG